MMVTENADNAVTQILSSDPHTVDRNAANISASLLFVLGEYMFIYYVEIISVIVKLLRMNLILNRENVNKDL